MLQQKGSHTWHLGWAPAGKAGSEALPQDCLVRVPQKNLKGVWDDDRGASAGITSPPDAAKSSLTETVYPQGS